MERMEGFKVVTIHNMPSSVFFQEETLKIVSACKPKWACKTLIIHQSLNYLDQIGKKSYIVLSEIDGIRSSTITDIRKSKSQLRQCSWWLVALVSW